jgi:hypothetical protein
MLPHILLGIKVLPDLLGCVDKMRYTEHNVKYTDKFLDLVQQVYLERKGVSLIGVPILEPKQWIQGL